MFNLVYSIKFCLLLVTASVCVLVTVSWWAAKLMAGVARPCQCFIESAGGMWWLLYFPSGTLVMTVATKWVDSSATIGPSGNWGNCVPVAPFLKRPWMWLPFAATDYSSRIRPCLVCPTASEWAAVGESFTCLETLLPPIRATHVLCVWMSRMNVVCACGVLWMLYLINICNI